MGVLKCTWLMYLATSCKSRMRYHFSHGCLQNHFSHTNTCTGQISLLWSKFELESKVSHLWKWHQQWDITFFDNVEICELSVSSIVIHEYHKFPSALGLLGICKEESRTCWLNFIPESTVGMWVNITAKSFNCSSRAHSSGASKVKDTYSWWCRIVWVKS